MEHLANLSLGSEPRSSPVGQQSIKGLIRRRMVEIQAGVSSNLAAVYKRGKEVQWLRYKSEVKGKQQSRVVKQVSRSQQVQTDHTLPQEQGGTKDNPAIWQCLGWAYIGKFEVTSCAPPGDFPTFFHQVEVNSCARPGHFSALFHQVFCSGAG
ncbi:hypothetical protein AB205_0025130 [Aquarana catesbeiana]|uniref:Uncharacterized protein n=1 Tax=Aquarana catesbeiana TaxID=8400 RepID=A0A2G9S2M3_AQUCT|nr:hypothetical protein AB205_0025130 [Aquarana catesbeiana]